MLIKLTGKVVSTHSSIFHCNGFGFGFGLYSFGSQYLYSSTSTSAPTNFLVNYLVDSLRFSKDEALLASSKVTLRKSLKDPDSVINFLKQTGFDNTHMKKLLSKAPKLLFYDVSKTLKPKFQCLMDLGLSGSDLVNVITKDTTIFERGLVTHLRPTIDCLRRTLGSDDNVLKAIKRNSWLLSFGAPHIMETNILLLKNSGVTDVRIKKLMLKNPRCIVLKPERTKCLLHRVEYDFRVPRDSPSFLYGFQVLNWQKKCTLDRKIEIFKSFGWSDDDILHMFQKLPFCLGLSEARIQEKLILFMKELGLGPAFLASRASIFIYSLDKRVVPRIQVLKILDEKKIKRRNLTLCYVLSLTESKFIEYFVLPYKDQVPDLYEPHKITVSP